MKDPLDTTKKTALQLAVVVGVCLTLWVWFGILGAHATQSTLYVLDVVQGDSQLVVLASENGRSAIKILIDGGKDKSVLAALDEALGSVSDKYLDLVILTHTDLDHMGGLIEVARRYDIGMFISNGRKGTSEAYSALQEVLTERNIPTRILLEGDAIRYGDNRIAVLSPNRALLQSKEVNESGVVVMLTTNQPTGGVNVLFTADIGFPAEQILLAKKYDLMSDILKVGHHGSKNSSGENFIAAVHPLISIIGVGKNSYGHPTPRVLKTLELAGSRVYRTDQNGTIKIPLDAEDKSVEPKAPSEGLLAAVANIMTGAYKNTGITTVSLRQAREETSKFNLVPHKECSFSSGSNPKHSPVIINEVAWMGSPGGATHEWIELRNLSPTSVNMSGWQVLNENERLRITFPQQSVFNQPYIVLARSAAQGALGLDATLTFAGALRNSNEGLRLYD